MGFYLVLLWFARVLLGFTGFYRVSPGFTGFHRVLLGFTMMESSPIICLSLSVSFTVTAMFVFFCFFFKSQSRHRASVCVYSTAARRCSMDKWRDSSGGGKNIKKKQAKQNQKKTHRGNECNLDDFCEFFFDGATTDDIRDTR